MLQVSGSESVMRRPLRVPCLLCLSPQLPGGRERATGSLHSRTYPEQGLAELCVEGPVPGAGAMA